MKYQLVSKTTKEVISTITTSNINSISAAKEYFLKVNKLFEVEKAKLTRREYKWWEEDKMITDEELNGKDGR